jgi:hypothetical protein
VIRTALPQPKCTKCQQTFQANWEFCPNDGTKRPQDQSAWKFCPFCSKPVAAESQRDIAAAPVTLTVPELAVVATPPARRYAAARRTRPTRRPRRSHGAARRSMPGRGFPARHRTLKGSTVARGVAAAMPIRGNPQEKNG